MSAITSEISPYWDVPAQASALLQGAPLRCHVTPQAPPEFTPALATRARLDLGGLLRRAEQLDRARSTDLQTMLRASNAGWGFGEPQQAWLALLTALRR